MTTRNFEEQSSSDGQGTSNSGRQRHSIARNKFEGISQAIYQVNLAAHHHVQDTIQHGQHGDDEDKNDRQSIRDSDDYYMRQDVLQLPDNTVHHCCQGNGSQVIANRDPNHDFDTHHLLVSRSAYRGAPNAHSNQVVHREYDQQGSESGHRELSVGIHQGASSGDSWQAQSNHRDIPHTNRHNYLLTAAATRSPKSTGTTPYSQQDVTPSSPSTRRSDRGDSNEHPAADHPPPPQRLPPAVPEFNLFPPGPPRFPARPHSRGFPPLQDRDGLSRAGPAEVSHSHAITGGIDPLRMHPSGFTSSTTMPVAGLAETFATAGSAEHPTTNPITTPPVVAVPAAAATSSASHPAPFDADSRISDKIEKMLLATKALKPNGGHGTARPQPQAQPQAQPATSTTTGTTTTAAAPAPLPPHAPAGKLSRFIRERASFRNLKLIPASLSARLFPGNPKPQSKLRHRRGESCASPGIGGGRLR
ncbi:hypothetical protein VTK26DRAFT_9322 [Humicola hyalothermophila]